LQVPPRASKCLEPVVNLCCRAEGTHVQVAAPGRADHEWHAQRKVEAIDAAEEQHLQCKQQQENSRPRESIEEGNRITHIAAATQRA